MRSFNLRFLLMLLTSVFFATHLCVASINFGSRDSKISVLSGARLNIGGSNFAVDGTISQDVGGIITGNKFTFDNGVLEQDSAEALLKGDFDPSAPEVLQFSGNGVLRGEPGNLIYGVLISGANNIISGQPTFVLPINLYDFTSELWIDIQNALSQSINLNGGLVTLINDLMLGDEVQLVGPGTIDLNDRQMNFGGSYKYPWSDELVFKNATSLVLTGSIKLDGTWYFNGECNLSGNGTILDLSGGGQIVLGPDTELFLEDLVIKGLGDTSGKIIFSSNTSKIYMSNVDACLDTTYTISVGQIIVEGPTTFALGSFDWNINTLASLTVDGVTLWLDTLGSGTATGAGHLNVSRAVYDVNGYNSANVAANIVDGTLVYENGGTIKQCLTQSGGFIDPAAAILLSGDVHVDVTMNYFIDVPSDKYINITGNMTLDGSGSTITFPNSGIPQFIVQPGITVNLTNITLSNINQNTFLLMPGAQINIGDNVVWSFVEDVIFDSPLINILPGGHLTWVGLDGVKYISLYNATDPNLTILNIDDSTLTLESIILDGVSHIAYGANSLIDLNGESGVNIDVSNGLNFKATGYENSLIFMNDALTLSGLIAFGSKSVNELHIAFALINGLSPDRIIGKEKYPLLNLSGGPGIIVGGPDNGTSRLIFDDTYVVLNLLDSNSIQLDINAHLKYEELEIRTNSIKQYSTRVLDDGTLMNGLQIDTSFIRSRLSRELRMINAGKKDLLRRIVDENEGETVSGKDIGSSFEAPEILRVVGAEQFFSTKEKDPKKIRWQSINFERFHPSGKNPMTRAKPKLFRTSIIEPNVFDQQYSGQYINASAAFSGIIEMRNSVFNNFFVDPTLNLDLYMKESSQLFQGLKDVSFDPIKHKVNVIGRGNIINVQRVMHFNNNLLIDKNASLEFKFVPTGYENPTVIFDKGTVLEISENSTLIFSGKGKVILSDGVIIKLLATVDQSKATISDKSTLIIKDGAVLDFESGANSLIQGIGNIFIQDSASIKPSVSGSLVIGSSESDEISIKVSGSSQICLEAPYISGSARISLSKLVTSLIFDEGGALIIGANGIFEANALNGVVSSGVVTDFSFRNGGFFAIKEDGKFVAASNRTNSVYSTNYDFSWGGFYSSISGGGVIEYKDSNTQNSFSGKVFALDDRLYTDIAKISFNQLALYLVSKMPTILTTSVLYERPDGIGVVITKNNVKVTLLAGDIIESDDDQGTIYGIDKDEEEFTISADGKRS